MRREVDDALSAAPVVGTTVQIQLSAPSEANRAFVLALSLASSPGITVGPGQVVPLAWDPVFEPSITAPTLIGLSGNAGRMNAAGAASVPWALPNAVSLVGFTVRAAFVTINAANGNAAEISSALPVTFEAPPAVPESATAPAAPRT